MASKRLHDQLSSMTTEQLRARMSLLGDEGARLRRIRPRPIAKLYGQRGPTPDQARRWKEESSAWNSAYRRNQEEHRVALGISNERYHAERDRAIQRTARDLEHEVAAVVVGDVLLA